MGTVWELDFYSRPLLDENQKKRWEILICEAAQSVASPAEEPFRFSQFVSNTEVNSITLATAIAAAIQQAPQAPSRIRFFRYQMQNMIVRACEEAGIPAKASRRTLALQQWLADRHQQVYPQLEGYKAMVSPSVAAPPPSPRPLPDPLMGKSWTFVSLPVAALGDMPEWDIAFGEAFPLEMAALPPDTPIPGLLIFSPRAMPLAGWMSGLELAELRLDPTTPPRLVMETGATESWVLASLGTPELQAEAERFEQAKQAANQLHFIGVQASPEAESFAGFWLMLQKLLSGT